MAPPKRGGFYRRRFCFRGGSRPWGGGHLSNPRIIDDIASEVANSIVRNRAVPSSESHSQVPQGFSIPRDWVSHGQETVSFSWIHLKDPIFQFHFIESCSDSVNFVQRKFENLLQLLKINEILFDTADQSHFNDEPDFVQTYQPRFQTSKLHLEEIQIFHSELVEYRSYVPSILWNRLARFLPVYVQVLSDLAIANNLQETWPTRSALIPFHR